MKLSVMHKEVLEVSGGWKASGTARIYFQREDGTHGIAEWEPKVAYGRTHQQAEEGLSKRIESQTKYFFKLFLESESSGS
jgi:hypothetical protein